MSEDELVRVGSESIKENGNPNFPGTDSAGNEPNQNVGSNNDTSCSEMNMDDEKTFSILIRGRRNRKQTLRMPINGEQRLQFEQLHTTLMKGHSDVGVGPVLDVYVGAVAVNARRYDAIVTTLLLAEDERWSKGELRVVNQDKVVVNERFADDDGGRTGLADAVWVWIRRRMLMLMMDLGVGRAVVSKGFDGGDL
ncbi:hypothetical protein KIW84_066470 [Lathyrus oleraceus]|uniref:Uncharacterized protein n=1 Tax=Pisum sativum TaxID=3888 RepID=A0A9D4WI84_PEA|nr:hypothetical protein KIW84_066470 [Pisum sativum]